FLNLILHFLGGLSDAQGNNSVGLDLSEFPALANRSRLESLSRVEGVPRLESIGGVSAPPGSIPSRPSYGVVSKPAEPQPDFSIHNEDFPALPGSSNFKSENNTESSTSQDPSKQQAMSTSSSVFPGTDLRGGASYEQALKDVAKDARYSTTFVISKAWYARDWRYHKEERLWLTRAPGVEPQLKTSSYERGTYYFFDCSTWRKVAKEFHLEYDKLDDKPTLQSVTA
ncbi:PREDICTED: CCR4-NOT transcription complex subunit 2-like, partial [Acropora digitifera]|uniref:CCR4-NOT transcription complex subunit 2-like n=1 Tax=Acropora digitifera TaxID=70779 RepID=UPI00077B0625